MKIEFRDLAFRYKTRPVFEHVNYTLENMGFTCLIGPNGAGKSTLLKCINGILTPSAGQVLAGGRDVHAMHIKERARIFGYVPQFTVVNPCLNVLETVISGRMPQMSGKASREDIEAAEKILNELDLASFALRPLHQLSGGERQRILVARALAQDPQVMLLDEPTSNLDLHYQLETMELMERMARQKRIGVIAVIHDLNSVLRYADEVLLLDRGGIRAAGTAREVINRDSVAESFKVDAAFTEAQGIPVMVPMSSLGK
jgi:iron complex transport system ATP-binding protein